MVASSVHHPRLQKFDSRSIRKFLRRYVEFCTEITEPAIQLSVGATPKEKIRPTSLKFGVYCEELRTFITLNMIDGVSDYNSPTDADLR